MDPLARLSDGLPVSQRKPREHIEEQPRLGSSERVPTEQGRLSKALTRLWMKRATVVANEQLADRFRLIVLEGAELKGVAWTAGQKVQIAMGSAFVTRTYTPIEWDPSAGRMRILGYAHGGGPGSTWVRIAAPGDECSLFGPRASLDVRRVPDPLVIAGDETAFGLAYAASHQERTHVITSLFEVDDVESARHVASHLDLQDVALFAKSRDDTHIAAMQAALSARMDGGTSFVLTGKAQTIQGLRQSLKQLGVPAARLVTKAFWAPGKTGLD